MALILDPETLKIICPSGDTGMFTVTFETVDGTPLESPISGVAVFAVCKQITRSAAYNTKARSEPIPIVDNTATVLITPGFSRQIEPGEYNWDIRIITDPAYDEETGQIITDENTDEVHSLFATRQGGMPVYYAPGVAVEIGGENDE